MTLFANDIGLPFLSWKTLVVLANISLASFLTVELIFSVVCVQQTRTAFVAIYRFALELSLLFVITAFSFDLDELIPL